MIIQYILVVFTILFILLWAIIKIKYPFWNNQPVFHTYDYIRSFYKVPFVVQQNGPYKTKYIDDIHVKTIHIDDENMSTIKDVTKLLQENYVIGERVDYMVQSSDIYGLHTGQNAVSFLSTYCVPEYTVKSQEPTKKVEIVKLNKVLGCITSRMVQMYIRPTNTEEVYTQIPVYFMDFLCVHREHDSIKISRNLVQTHEYNQRVYNKNIQCSLLKKEGEHYAGIRPLITYKAYTYNLNNKKIIRMKPTYNIRLLTPNTMTKYVDFFTYNTYIEQKTRMFDIMVLPDLGNITLQVKEKQLYVGCLYRDEDILGFYFLKDVKQYNDEYESKTLSLVASIQNCRDGHLFYIGFLHVLRHIIHQNADYKVLNIENIGHNETVHAYFTQENAPVQSINMSYYSYNYVYPGSPFNPIRSFILV